MKFFPTLLAIAAIALLSPSSVPLHAAEKSVTAEPFGKLALDQKADDILKLLGKPASMGRDTLMAATGEWVQQWHYPALGLEIGMASAKRGVGKTISTIKATAECKLATARGISIGSPEEAVRKAYRNAEDKQQSRRGETFVAGSVYGGVIFGIKNGKVASIFIGAAAE